MNINKKLSLSRKLSKVTRPAHTYEPLCLFNQTNLGNSLVVRIVHALSYLDNVVIKSDNGSHFITKGVKEYLGLIGIDQEFTHLVTPEENAHIEAYHGILKKEVFQRFEYRIFREIEDH